LDGEKPMSSAYPLIKYLGSVSQFKKLSCFWRLPLNKILKKYFNKLKMFSDSNSNSFIQFALIWNKEIDYSTVKNLLWWSISHSNKTILLNVRTVPTRDKKIINIERSSWILAPVCDTISNMLTFILILTTRQVNVVGNTKIKNHGWSWIWSGAWFFHISSQFFTGWNYESTGKINKW